MMRSFLLAGALLLAAVPAGAQEPEAMRDLTFGEYTRDAYIRELPVHFRIPDGYVPVSPDGRATRTYWTSRADSAAQAADPEHAMRDGFYLVTISMNVGYDAENDRFFSSDESDETTMKTEFEAQGFTGVSVERHRVNGYPVLFVEAEQGGRRAMLVYVASLVDTNTIMSFYTHPEPFRELDGTRWAAFKAAMLASPPPAAQASAPAP